MSDWHTTALGGMVDLLVGPAFPSARFTENPHDLPLLRGINVGVGGLRWDSTKRWPRTDSAAYGAYELRPGDAILAMDRPWIDAGLKVAIARDHDVPALLVQRVARLRATVGNDQGYLGALVRSPAFSQYVQTITSGTAVPHVSATDLKAFPCRVPSLTIQRRVGAVIAAFDELVQINERRIELLEGLARLLYREWFARSRPSTGTSAPHGVPAGWEPTDLGSIATWYSGGTPSTKNDAYWVGGIPWITSGCLKTVLLSESDRTLTSAGVASGSRMVDRDAVLVVVRGMSLLRKVRAGIAERSLAFGQDCKALVAVDGVEPMFLAFTVLDRQATMQSMVELAGHGTGKLSTDRIKALPVTLPPIALQQKFVDAVTPIRAGISSAMESARSLARTRDLLLPRLVTGRVDVSEIDLKRLVGGEGEE